MSLQLLHDARGLDGEERKWTCMMQAGWMGKSASGLDAREMWMGRSASGPDGWELLQLLLDACGLIGFRSARKPSFFSPSVQGRVTAITFMCVLHPRTGVL